MTESMADLLRTDAELTALAERRPPETDDAALRMLAEWAADVDAHAIGDEPGRDAARDREKDQAGEVDDSTPPAKVMREQSRRRAVAVRATALAAALTLSSGGVAAAVGGDPLAPLSYVVTKLTTIGDDTDRGNTIFGQRAPGRSQLHDARSPGADEGGRAAAQRHEASPGQHSDDTTPSLPTERGGSNPSHEAETGRVQSGGSAGSGADPGDDAPSDPVDAPDRPAQESPPPSGGDDDRPSKPRRLQRPDATPSPHGPDGPVPEKPETQPAPDPATDPTLDPDVPVEPPPDTPS